MGLGGAMNSGVSGLQSFSNAMSVIGNNLANTNTSGFKASRTLFSDLSGFKASRTLFSDLMPDTVSGSGGSSQVGRGSSLSVVDDIFKQGSIESTSSNLDLAIEGSGFFMVRNPENQTENFTRAGTFRLDEQGNLTNPEGYIVQGYASNGDGTFEDLTTDIQINTRSFVPGQASTEVGLTTNLDAQDTPVTWDLSNPTMSSNFATTSEVYDSLGNTHLISTYFNKTGDNTWEYHQTVPSADIDNAAGNSTDGLATISGDAVTGSLAAGDLLVNNEPVGAATGVPASASNTLAQDIADAIVNTANYNGTATVGSSTSGVLGPWTEVTNGEDYTLNINGDGSDLLSYSSAGSDIDAATMVSAIESHGQTSGTLAGGDLIYTDDEGNQLSINGTSGNDLTFTSADGADIVLTETTSNGEGFTSTLSGGMQENYGNITLSSAEDINLSGNNEAAAGFSNNASATYEPTMVEVASGEFQFDSQGLLSQMAPDGGTTITPEDAEWPNVSVPEGNLDWNNGAATDQSLEYDMNLTQFATDSKVVTQQANGYSSGYLTDLAVDSEGTIAATYSNGEVRDMARLALGKFSSNNGLEKLGKNLYQATNDSGPADIGMPGSGVGKIFSNSLEQSTVDIAEEFTKMITTQRSFQANSKTITTTDEMLSQVINMKR